MNQRRVLLRAFGALPLMVASTLPAMAAVDVASRFVSSRLKVWGYVEHPLSLSLGDLDAMNPLAVADIPVRARDGSLVATKSGYRGLRLTDVLDRAVIKAPDHNSLKRTVILARATDGYTVAFSWAELYNSPLGEDVYVLVGRDGAALGEDEGRIALISSRDLRTGPRHVKWLNALEVRRLK